MKLDVTYDPVCPWCFLGVTQLQRAIADTAVQDLDVTLWPYQLAQEVPPQGVDNRQFFEQRVGKARTIEMFSKMETLASAAGIVIDYARISSMPNTLLAHQLVGGLTRGPESLSLALDLMNAHFSGAANIGERAQLTEIASRRGFTVEQINSCWNSVEAADIITTSQKRAHRLAISGVPHYVVNGTREEGAISEQRWKNLFTGSAPVLQPPL